MRRLLSVWGWQCSLHLATRFSLSSAKYANTRVYYQRLAMNINFTLFAQAAAFAVFIWFTVRFVWPPLMRAIDSRQKTIADGLAAGERGRQELELASHRSAD